METNMSEMKYQQSASLCQQNSSIQESYSSQVGTSIFISWTGLDNTSLDLNTISGEFCAPYVKSVAQSEKF